MNFFFPQNPTQGATSVVYAAVSKEVEGRGGIYISNCGAISPNNEADNPDIRERLFKLSLEQTGLKDFV